MKTIAVFAFSALVLNAAGQVKLPETVSAHSRSGQFVVYAPRPPATGPVARSPLTNAALVRLEPSLLAISCERIKQALLHELGVPDRWRGKIYIALHPFRSADENIVVRSSRFSDGWRYQIELPDAAEPPQLVRAVTRVLLLEMANRSAGARSAELPAWLAEGMPEQLLTSSDIELVIRPPQWAVNNVLISPAIREALKTNALNRAHERLRRREPLTLEELSWPVAEQLAGEAGEIYRSSAQLFIYELLRLKNGRACFSTFLGELPHHLNWQTGFFRAFSAHFKRLLDLEKWWALRWLHFTGRELARTWTREESWRKLDEILRPPVQVRLETNELPFQIDVPLQAIVREWDYDQQTPALRDKVRQLEVLELRLAPELVSVADDYRRTLQVYLQRMGKAGAPTGQQRNRSARQRIVEDTLKQLDAIDAKREALRSMLAAGAEARANPAQEYPGVPPATPGADEPAAARP